MLGAFFKFLGELFSTTAVEDSGDPSKCPFLNPSVLLEKKEEVQEITEDSLVYPEFDKALERFNPNSDILVLSAEYIEDFDHIYQSKLQSLGNKVIIFPRGTLVARNVAIVTAGYSPSANYGLKKI